MTAIAAGAHALFLGAFFLPWVQGGFGQRESLSGRALAALALDAATVDFTVFRAIATVALFASPALAAGALVILLAQHRLGLAPRSAHALAATAGAVPAATVLVFLAGVPLEAWDERFESAAAGLLVAFAAALVALVASVLAIRRPMQGG